MNWEQKLQALNCLVPTSLKMRKPGDWYVNIEGSRSIGGNGILERAYGNGRTPEAAVENDWLLMTSIPYDRHIRLSNRSVRWNEFMWEEL